MRSHRRRCAFSWRGLLLVVLCNAGAFADRPLDKSEYADKLRGMWFGQLIGNHTGRPTEGQYTLDAPLPPELFVWDLHTDCANPWTGDDDTNVEYMYLHALETHGPAPTYAELQAEWEAHVGLDGFFIANKQAIYLMSHGFDAPATGSWRHNLHAYAIDCQITTESIGAYSPGIRQWAMDTVGRCSRITNDGYPVHAAQFYAAMYSQAAFESDIPTIIEMAHACLPASSRSWQIINDVRTWHAADMQDGIADWPATRALMYAKYRHPANGRYRVWVESTINLGCTTMALLYGNGDFEETIRIGVLLGFDNDCNPATAGGLIGLIEGYSNLPTSLTATATDCYRIDFLTGLPVNESVSAIADRMADVAESVVISLGGSSDGTTMLVPDDPGVVTEPERPNPAGPDGLVALVQSRGGSVTTDASVFANISTRDRFWLDGIIDGIKDVTYNGHLAYWTNDGNNAQPAGGDFYALAFSETLRFDSVTFYEGDAYYYSINADPRVVEPIGGYFLDLDVEVLGSDGWRSVNNLAMSEPLEPFAYYQVIEMSFDPIAGDAIRIRGNAGGQYQFTSIVEFECNGGIVGDLNGDNVVDGEDVPLFAAVLLNPGQHGAVPLAASDANADDQVNGFDISCFVSALLN